MIGMSSLAHKNTDIVGIAHPTFISPHRSQFYEKKIIATQKFLPINYLCLSMFICGAKYLYLGYLLEV